MIFATIGEVESARVKKQVIEQKRSAIRRDILDFHARVLATISIYFPEFELEPVWAYVLSLLSGVAE